MLSTEILLAIKIGKYKYQVHNKIPTDIVDKNELEFMQSLNLFFDYTRSELKVCCEHNGCSSLVNYME